MFQTVSGVEIKFKKIRRQNIDEFFFQNPPPVAPMKQVRIWGGLVEDVPDETDGGFQSQRWVYFVRLKRKMFELVKPGLIIINEKQDAGLTQIGLEGGLYAGLKENELDEIVNMVFFLSTVTNEAIDEWGARFAVSWHNKSIGELMPPGSPLSGSSFFRDFNVAKQAGYKWDEFCDLSGSTQSREVAYSIIQSRIKFIEQNNQ